MTEARYHARRRAYSWSRSNRWIRWPRFKWHTFRKALITTLIMTLVVNYVINPLANLLLRSVTGTDLQRSSRSQTSKDEKDRLSKNLHIAALDTSSNNDNPKFHALDHLNTTAVATKMPQSDAFATYAYRDHPRCSISSLDLHLPHSPLCSDRAEFLAAFNSGGRIGFDAPYILRGCDMRWYYTKEACEIFSRFEKVIFVGDSMMRHVVGALNVILREDLGYGAVTGWNFGDEEMAQCFCTHQMDVKACSMQGIYRTEDVLEHDPSSFKCPKTANKIDGKLRHTSSVNLVVELMLKYPLDPVEIQRFQDLLPSQRPERPVAFVFGHGLWNDLDLQATVHWLNGILEAIYEKAEYLTPDRLPKSRNTGQPKPNPMAHALFITPSAPGILKPDQWVQTQGDKAIQVFESSMHNLIHGDGAMFSQRGLEHMGTWNMSVQMHKWDGVHLDLKGNLIKAMGVINWLAGIEVNVW